MFGREFPPGPPPQAEIHTGETKFDVATELMITTVLKVAESAASGIEEMAETGKFPKRAAYMLSLAAAKEHVKAAFGDNTPECREAMARFLKAGWVPPLKDSQQPPTSNGVATHG
ncbi:hypothetical protein ONA92_21515 [Mycobacteroides salmoniphilum]|uniref:hypothetical protein n=1 Tax=Mycobacteroides salmoniphilum TaxID=404941 RepID=UPI003562420F